MILCSDDYVVSKRAPLLREHTPDLHAQMGIAAVNLFVESDGSQPDKPVYLCGGGQARHHRVVCNRGHNLLRSYVESQDSGTFHERAHLETTLSPLLRLDAVRPEVVGDEKSGCRRKMTMSYLRKVEMSY